MAILDFPTSPTLNQTYSANGKTWTWDGTAWISKAYTLGYTGSTSTATTVSGTAPVAPNNGDIWWNSEEGQLKIYYNDGTSGQWVDAANGRQGISGYTGSVGYTGSASTTQGYTGSAVTGFTGSIGFSGSRGFTGSASTTQGYTGSGGGYIGSTGYFGSRGFTGSIGFTGSRGFTGSASTTQGFTGSQGPAGGYTGSQGVVGSTGYTGSSSPTMIASVYLTAATNTTTAGWQKVPLDTVEFDTDGIWDATNKWFKPTKAGYYTLHGRVRTGSTVIIVVGIAKNGSLFKAVGGDPGSGSFVRAEGASATVYANGTTDYFELFVYTTSVGALTTGTFDTYLQIEGPLAGAAVGYTGSSNGTGYTGSSGIVGYTGSIPGNAILSNTTTNLTVGYTSSAYPAGSQSTGTFTPNPVNGSMQYTTNDGAHTLAPPTTGTGDSVNMVLHYTNGASAGAITTSGFTKVTGDTITLTSGHKFFFYITVYGTSSHLNVVALQ